MSDETYGHLIPLVEALISAGNRLASESTSGFFKLSQGGPYCALEGPLQFEAVRQLPRRPEVVFSEANDYISCSHCWALIRGGRYMAAENRRASN